VFVSGQQRILAENRSKNKGRISAALCKISVFAPSFSLFTSFSLLSFSLLELSSLPFSPIEFFFV
jgi:hypothetical protein